jgi:hypothetical protein
VHWKTGNTQHLIGAFALRDLGKTSEARALEESLRSSGLSRSNGDQDFVLMADVVSVGPNE